ncbi:MAG TPA: hypothetical protein VFB72_17170 [Verrucomicrobiae bacterium]|nr:hypothetical protein [Verrucomicrobiae bacterium]
MAIATGAFIQTSFGAPQPRGATSSGTATSSGSASGGINASSDNATTGTSQTTPQNPNSPGNPALPGTNTTIQSRQSAAPTTSDGQSGTAVAPGGTVTTPAPSSQGHVSSDTTINGTTNYNQNQKYPVYRGTDHGPAIQSYSQKPAEPPQIIGTVSGENGVMYYISADGYMYSREHDGHFKRFGRFQRHNPNDNLYGMTVTPDTVIPGNPDTGNPDTGTVAPAAPVAPDNTTVPPGTTAAPTTPDNDAAHQQVLEDEHRRLKETVDAEYQREAAQRERERRESEEDDRNRFRITGKLIGNDGQIYYLGSNGYVYYRAGDGHLHMVGGGVPE